jgi:transcriptional regulator with XRE-family HTH domain
MIGRTTEGGPNVLKGADGACGGRPVGSPTADVDSVGGFETHSASDNLAVGVRLREARVRKAMSLAQVAARAGLSRSFLSKAERGLTSASLTSLLRWTRALDIRFASLFEALPTPVSGRSPGLCYRGSGVLEYLLTPSDERRFEVFEQHLDPGHAPSRSEWSVDADFAFIYVVSGRLEFLQGDHALALRQGDLHVYAPREPHRWVNPSSQRTVILVGDSPASF